VVVATCSGPGVDVYTDPAGCRIACATPSRSHERAGVCFRVWIQQRRSSCRRRARRCGIAHIRASRNRRRGRPRTSAFVIRPGSGGLAGSTCNAEAGARTVGASPIACKQRGRPSCRHRTPETPSAPLVPRVSGSELRAPLGVEAEVRWLPKRQRVASETAARSPSPTTLLVLDGRSPICR